MYIFVSMKYKSSDRYVDFIELTERHVGVKFEYFDNNVVYFFLDTKDRTIESLTLSEIKTLLDKNIKLYGFKEADGKVKPSVPFYELPLYLSELNLTDFVLTMKDIRSEDSLISKCKFLKDNEGFFRYNKLLKAPQLGILLNIGRGACYIQTLNNHARLFNVIPTTNLKYYPSLDLPYTKSVDNTKNNGLDIIADSVVDTRKTVSGFYEYCQETWGNEIIYWATLYD